MTNTLHRYGDAESFYDDYVIFASPSTGKNDQNCIPKLKKFLEMALLYKPVNIGDPSHGGALRPCKHESARSHWHRDVQPRLRAVIDGIDEPASVAAVFDNQAAAAGFLKALKDADLGLCINLSTSIEGARRCSTCAGVAPHSIGYSLGFQGNINKMPNTQVLALTTMCGHGMISSSLGKKMIDWVKEDRRSPEEAVAYLTRFCSCGVFNPARARRILEDSRKKME